MNSRYFLRLAIQSIEKHRQTYLPYMIAVSCYVAMFYLLIFLRDNLVVTQSINATVFEYVLSIFAYAFGIFVLLFLIYSNNFLILPRTKEFGLLYLFGLSQRHLLIIMFYEVAITYIISILFGLTVGIVMSRLMSMVLSAMVKIPLMLQQLVDLSNILTTVGLFLGVMGIVFIINIIQIVRAKPISLMHKLIQPKLVSWHHYVLLTIGILCIGYAYWAIISLDSSQRAFNLMVQIVFAIVVGTYSLFVSLSVTILRLLVQRPTFYYRQSNFIVLNGLLHRIRHNAVGLASVSIFAFLILSIVSMAGVIYFGANESIQKMYAADVIVTVQEYNLRSKDELYTQLTEVVTSQGMNAKVVDEYLFFSVAAVQNQRSFTYQPQNQIYVGESMSHYFVLVTVDEYNRIYNQSLQLAPGEVAVYSSYVPLPDEFELQGLTYQVVQQLPPLSIANYDLEQLVNAQYVIVHDRTVLEAHERMKFVQTADFPAPIRYRIGINIAGTEEQELEVYNAIKDFLATTDVISREQQFPNNYFDIASLQSRQVEKIAFEIIYGTLLFLSLFLGVLFLMSTALLIYYKQLSEGYEDKTRYEILQRIGMTHDEVRRSVDKQIVVLFSIPIVVSGVHFVMSLHLIEYLLELFRIENLLLLMWASVTIFFVFCIVYLIIYRVSARVYYNIVR